MTNWKRKKFGELAVYQANNIAWFPGVVQGFTTRHGGLSAKPYDSLNMSDSVGDLPANVAENRHRALEAIAGSDFAYVTANQVHGGNVAVVEEPWETNPDADALVTDQPHIALVMLFADCVPIFFFDPIKRVIALAHAGWRGAAANIAHRTVAAMVSRYECAPRDIFAAIGPSISADRFEVGLDVLQPLQAAWNSSGASAFTIRDEFAGKFSANLRLIVYDQLQGAGLNPDHVAVCDVCTFDASRDFFSHRRDASKLGKTGRMAGIIGLRPVVTADTGK